MTGTLDLEKLYNSPTSRVTIVHPGNKKTTTGVIESDFGFDMTSMFDDKTQLNNGTISQGLNAVANTTGQFSQMVMTDLRQTLSQWLGSNKPIFPVPLTIVSYKPDIKPVDIVSELMAGCTAESPGALVLKAPNGYGATKFSFNVGETLTGTWTIQLGQWFRATGLVLLGCSAVFSKETARSTKQPLMARVTLTFQPAILPTADTVRGWFINKT